MTLPETDPQVSITNRHFLPPSPIGGLRELVRDPLNYFLFLTRQYGDVVCYRPAPDTAFLVNHPDYIHYILVENQRNYSKDTYSNQAFKRAIGSALVNLEGDAWLNRRRLMQPSFHHSRLELLDEMIVGAASEMLDQWQACYERDQPVDIAREMAALTMTITARAFFGVNLGAEAKKIGELINGVASLIEKPNHPHLRQAIQEFTLAVDSIIEQRRNNPAGQGDLLGSLINAHAGNGDNLLDAQQLRNEVMDLLLAGYETTANALTWTFYLLSQNLWAFERLRSEVRLVLGERQCNSLDLVHLPYLQCILDESLRLFPPAWIIGRRAIAEDVIGGYHVPAGTVIAICIYTLHRHPALWEQPDLFDPQRFTPERSASRNRYAYMPFSIGPRQCIGANFAVLEARLILASIAQRFELHLVPGTLVQPMPLFVLRPNRDLQMSLHS